MFLLFYWFHMLTYCMSNFAYIRKIDSNRPKIINIHNVFQSKNVDDVYIERLIRSDAQNKVSGTEI